MVPSGNAPGAREIGQALDLRKMGKDWRGRCPSCGSRTSFSVTDGESQLLVHCFAGCERRSIIAELRPMGLWPEATEAQKQAARAAKTEREIAWAKRVFWWWRELDSQGGWTPTGQDWADWRRADAILKRRDEPPPGDEVTLYDPSLWSA